jgi:hypothetical protein
LCETEHEHKAKPRKLTISPHTGTGTAFGKTDTVRLKLTDRDLILIAGIVVAAIIALTTLIMDAQFPQGDVKSNLPSLMKTTPSPTVLINKIGQRLFQR